MVSYPAMTMMEMATKNVSIPFLSGHGFLRDIPNALEGVDAPSQSPSYRVMVSYKAKGLTIHELLLVSIPFLSGHGFLLPCN